MTAPDYSIMLRRVKYCHIFCCHLMSETPPSSPPLAEPPNAPRRHNRGLWSLLGGALSTVVTMALLAPVLAVVGLFVPGPLQADHTVIIAHGAHVSDIAAQLAREDGVYVAPLFQLAARLVAGGTLRAGEYALAAHVRPIDIARMMHEGRVVIRNFTVAEGLTSMAVVDALNDNPVLTGTVEVRPAEGSLLPETYRYTYGDSREGMIARMQKAMQDKVNELWAARGDHLVVTTPHQAVILASIVEKETGKADERPRIAGVFANRLRQNMRLQSDPTVIYALSRGSGDLDRPLTHQDLAFPSPINTYASDGLPPQPICNPGRAAIEAVLHPEAHKFLYFVANGNGGHAFAEDLAAHNANINLWHKRLEMKK